VRIVEKHPYEITETGWGEFDIQVFSCFYRFIWKVNYQIKLYFVDVNEKPVRLSKLDPIPMKMTGSNF
jgi:hypothetical protein